MQSFDFGLGSLMLSQA